MEIEQSYDLRLNKYGERIETVGGVSLNLEYWDCDCEENYIHSSKIPYCKICNTYEDDSPNSRMDEVEWHIRENGDEYDRFAETEFVKECFERIMKNDSD